MLSIEENKIYRENKKAELVKQKSKYKLSKVKPVATKPTKASSPKLKKKTPVKLRKAKLLKRAKQVVYARDKNICQHCGVSCIGFNRHASHVIPVSATGRLALYPLNMKVMCYHCHMNWWHKNPIEAYKWFSEKFPERLIELQKLKLSIPMGSIGPKELDDIENMIYEMECLYGII